MAARKKLIENLTPEQEADLPIFRQQYLDIACGGGRIDREALQDGLSRAYARIGKPAPALLVFTSPTMCMMALKVLKVPKVLKVHRWPKQFSRPVRGPYPQQSTRNSFGQSSI